MVQPEFTTTYEHAVNPSPAASQSRVFTEKDDGQFRRGPAHDKTKLKRELSAWQILMIGIGGVIGVTIFSTNGEIIHTAGPAGLLVALIFVSITTICVMECIAEMVVMWPVSNAMVEFVKQFVDRDLAIVVGIAYWYTWSSVFASLIVVAFDFASFWLTDETWRVILFFVVVPVGLLAINCVGVKTFGWVEGMGGILKLLLVLAGILFMIVDAAKVGNKNIDASFQHWPDEANNNFTAVCICIPVLAYGFIGTEIVAVTAFEARDRKSLRFPVRWVAYIVSGIYFACGILQMVVINYRNCNLQDFNGKWFDCPGRPETRRSIGNSYLVDENEHGPKWVSIMVLAAWDYGSKAMGWFFNASVVYFCLSAANTALYVASRTLFGLTRGINHMKPPPWYLKPFRYFGMTSSRVGVPHFALLFSAIAFFWLPFLRLRFRYSASDVNIIMSTTGSIGGVIVWLTQCVAYIRYYYWFHNLKKMDILPGEFNRWHPKPEIYDWHKHRTFLASLRLLPACIGLVGCFLIVFVLSSATFWNRDITDKKLVIAYAVPVILLVMFILLKLWKRRWWVRLENTSDALFQVTNYFEENAGISLIELAPVEMVTISNGH